MSVPLPESPRLSHLKGQAKSLLRAIQRQDSAARDRVRAAHPRFAATDHRVPLRLADIQFVLACEYGFESWTRLKQYVAVRDPEILHEAFETVKDGWISPDDVPGDPAKLRRLLRTYPDLVHARIGKRGYTLLHFAAYRNYREIAHLLIAAGADPLARSPGGATPLAVALTYPAPDVARLLLPFGRIPDNLRTAAALNDLERMRSFFDTAGQLRPEASVDREEWAPAYDFADRPLQTDPIGILGEALLYATWNGRLEAMKFLTERGASVNRIIFIGTPLHWAALYGQRASVDFLIEAGADPNLRDDEFAGLAAGWADYYGHKELAEYLLERGATAAEGANAR
jgi:ankyrin repeat protein